MSTHVRQREARAIPACPTAGEGVHAWCYHVYNRLRSEGECHEQAASYCEQHATRRLTPGDIPNGHTPGSSSPRPRFIKPSYQPDRLTALARRMDGFSFDDLAARSAIRPDNRTPASFLHAIYKPGERILCFSEFVSQGQALWVRPAADQNYNARGLDPFTRPAARKGAWFLCNPVNGKWLNLDRLKNDTNPTGRTRRAEENLTAFRFLVVESDKADPALWLAGLVQMPLPIVAIYSSGGKSIHALVRVNAENSQHWREIKSKLAPTLVTLGADHSAMTAVRLTRLPQCYRAEKDRWQTLYYLNPKADETPISQLARG